MGRTTYMGKKKNLYTVLVGKFKWKKSLRKPSRERGFQYCNGFYKNNL